METWYGFSTEDIKNVQLTIDKSEGRDVSEISEENSQDGQTQSTVKASKINKPYKKPAQNFISGKSLAPNDCIYPVPEEARLTERSEETMNTADSCSNSSLETPSTASSHSSVSQNLNENTSPSKQSAGSQGKTVTILVGEDKSYKVIPSSLTDDPTSKVANDFNGDTFIRSHQKAFLLEKDRSKGQDKISLEQFQERQKLMEEQNKRKKELLTKAIADRKRRTQSEAKKLLQIQEELSRLDALLSTDVGILRNQIELASYEFNEAQKRYDRAESEFIEAKMHLFSKLERKELLTEHLCRIIEANEQRKARKLSELMAKLEISDENYNANLSDSEAPVFPQAVSLNKITYTTLKHPSQGTVLKENISLFQSLIPEENNLENPTTNESKSIDKHMNKTPFKGNDALESVNLITAQSLDHRNESVPCDLNISENG